MAAIDQAAQDKRVQERRAARKKKSAEKSAARKAKRAAKSATRKAAKAKKGEGAVAKTLRTWSPGKYAAKLIKGEPIGQPEKAAPKKAAPQSFGKSFSSARKAGKKTFTWKGKSYTTKTADDAKKAAPKKAAPKKAAPKKAAPKALPIGQSYEKEIGQSYEKEESYSPLKKSDSKDLGPTPDRKYAKGGKVECDNAYGWPSRDARNGGKK